MTILHIETSTNICSVSLSNNGETIFQRADEQGLNHAKLLSPFVQQAIEKGKKEGVSPQAIAVGGGPGSYTGLRIGVSTAKGLCLGFGIPLIAIDTLKIIAVDALIKQQIQSDSLLCPMLDARRMEVYTTIFDHQLQPLLPTIPKIIDEDSFMEQLTKQKIYFFGNGAEKCKNIITHPNAIFLDNINPMAYNMITIAEEAFRQKNFVDVAYFEPYYLKDFQATIPKKNIY